MKKMIDKSCIGASYNGQFKKIFLVKGAILNV